MSIEESIKSRFEDSAKTYSPRLARHVITNVEYFQDEGLFRIFSRFVFALPIVISETMALPENGGYQAIEIAAESVVKKVLKEMKEIVVEHEPRLISDSELFIKADILARSGATFYRDVLAKLLEEPIQTYETLKREFEAEDK